MEPSFSEFSYGYAITSELVTGSFGPVVGAPVFPSLYAEGKKGGGYDVKIPYEGVPLFLQFKLSHYLCRSNASEWDSYGKPYYRVYLRPLRHSDQHNLLIALEQYGNDVYYVAPEFHTVSELDDYYSDHVVSDHSSFFSPLEIGELPDDDYHYLTFVTSDAYYEFHSTALALAPRPEKRFRFSKVDFENRLIKRLKEPVGFDEHYFDDLAYKLIRILSKSMVSRKAFGALESQLWRRAGLAERVRSISYMARAYMDTEFILTATKGMKWRRMMAKA